MCCGYIKPKLCALYILYYATHGEIGSISAVYQINSHNWFAKCLPRCERASAPHEHVRATISSRQHIRESFVRRSCALPPECVRLCSERSACHSVLLRQPNPSFSSADFPNSEIILLVCESDVDRENAEQTCAMVFFFVCTDIQTIRRPSP